MWKELIVITKHFTTIRLCTVRAAREPSYCCKSVNYKIFDNKRYYVTKVVLAVRMLGYEE